MIGPLSNFIQKRNLPTITSSSVNGTATIVFLVFVGQRGAKDSSTELCLRGGLPRSNGGWMLGDLSSRDLVIPFFFFALCR